MILKPLKALNGDCMILSSSIAKNKINILIDGGPKTVYRISLKQELSNIIKFNESIDYIFITHVDDDHIAGIIDLFNNFELVKKLKIKEIFFNHYDKSEFFTKSKNISYNQGNKLSASINTLNQHLKSEDLPSIRITECKKGDKYILGNIEINVLSPSIKELKTLYKDWNEKKPISNNIVAEEDYSININDFTFDKNRKTTIQNSSSISFLAIENEKSVLLTGDALPSTITKSITELGYSKENKLKLDFMKLSHHGGENSVNFELLDIIDCSRYLITTNGRKYKHPKKKTLAYIIKQKEVDLKNNFNNSRNLYFYFNYKRNIFNENDKSPIKFKCIYEEVIEI
ncbi:MBL fold metallo-hydrolase [Clostridium gasigenes]|uniref:ComEC/Rec2 family competence protein n=1 Tax=Clostridium gasigenes TaxID=94869 RepID=UPI00162A7B74|nr:MBL fold metallo-hydrolase [Clostridium gasigenes]MBB6624819.1 MBL fold metallo-hydrolase [Clostridium gasigenes]